MAPNCILMMLKFILPHKEITAELTRPRGNTTHPPVNARARTQTQTYRSINRYQCRLSSFAQCSSNYLNTNSQYCLT